MKIVKGRLATAFGGLRRNSIVRHECASSALSSCRAHSCLTIEFLLTARRMPGWPAAQSLLHGLYGLHCEDSQRSVFVPFVVTFRKLLSQTG